MITSCIGAPSLKVDASGLERPQHKVFVFPERDAAILVGVGHLHVGVDVSLRGLVFNAHGLVGVDHHALEFVLVDLAGLVLVVLPKHAPRLLQVLLHHALHDGGLEGLLEHVLAVVIPDQESDHQLLDVVERYTAIIVPVKDLYIRVDVSLARLEALVDSLIGVPHHVVDLIALDRPRLVVVIQVEDAACNPLRVVTIGEPSATAQLLDPAGQSTLKGRCLEGLGSDFGFDRLISSTMP